MSMGLMSGVLPGGLLIVKPAFIQFARGLGFGFRTRFDTHVVSLLLVRHERPDTSAALLTPWTTHPKRSTATTSVSSHGALSTPRPACALNGSVLLHPCKGRRAAPVLSRAVVLWCSKALRFLAFHTGHTEWCGVKNRLCGTRCCAGPKTGVSCGTREALQVFSAQYSSALIK